MSTVEENAVIETEQEVYEHEESPYDDLAKNYGWDAGGKKSSKEYIEFALEKFPKRGEALSNQNKKLEAKDSELYKMKIIVDQLAQDMKNSKDTAYKQALADLQSQKREAIAAGDIAQVEKLETVAADLTNSQVVAAAQQQFFSRNPWFNGDSTEELAMRAYAQKKDNELMSEKLSPTDHMNRVESLVKDRFKEYFDGVQDNDAPVKRSNIVEGVQQENNVVAHRKSKVHTFNDLNDAQRVAATYFKENGQMSIENYIKILAESGELK